MRPAPWSIALAAVALVTAGCASVPVEYKQAAFVDCPTGSDCFDPRRPTGPGGSLRVEAGEFYFEILEGEAQEGPVEITLVNVGGAEHNITIDEAAGETDAVAAAAGATETGVLELFSGTYTYYCSVPGHREAGMEGRLEVLGGVQVPLPDPGPTGVPSPTEPIGDEGAATPGEPGGELDPDTGLSPPPNEDGG